MDSFVYDDKMNCSGCTACESVCPVQAISMRPDEKGFLYPVIDKAVCTGCGECRKICPFKANVSGGKNEAAGRRIYALKHVKDPVRAASTSGGVFTAISDLFLEKGGVVYGAVFDKDFKVSHARCLTRSERDLARGSKYVQSDLGDVFPLIRADLSAGREVLFSGTPCQVAGLRAFLGVVPDNLFCCDLVCHGVPSPRIFQQYLELLRKRYGDVLSIEFRNKSRGWSHFSFVARFADNIKQSLFNDDPYCYLFSLNIMLRPSCYVCKFADIFRVGDVTMGDFWGIEKSLPGFKDERGVSLLILNTPKGNRLFNMLGETVICEPSDVAACRQPNLVGPTPRHPRSERFWQDYFRKGLEYVIDRYTLENPMVRIDQGFRLWLGTAWFFPYLRRVKRSILRRS